MSIYRPDGNNSVPLTIAAGEAVVVQAGALVTLSVRPGAGATVTVTQVDLPTATAHGARDVTTDATSVYGVPVSWPYYRVSTTGGPCTIAGV